MTEKEMKVQEKAEVEQNGEPTKPVKQFVPAVDIFETAEAVTLLADMPGVSKDGVDIKLEDGILTLKGNAVEHASEGRRELLREYEVGNFNRRFTISEAIDQDKISASIANGVLKVVLHKVKPAQPRKIEVRNG